MKKILSLCFTVIMIFTLLVIPVSASESNETMLDLDEYHLGGSII